MNFRLFMAITASVALTAVAQAQQPRPPAKGPKPTVADVQRVVTMISADKAKTQVYCDLGKLDEQMMQASQKKDKKTLDELGKKMADMEQQLGPDYAKLMDQLQQVDPNSKDGKQLSAAFESLDKQCKP